MQSRTLTQIDGDIDGSGVYGPILKPGTYLVVVSALFAETDGEVPTSCYVGGPVQPLQFSVTADDLVTESIVVTALRGRPDGLRIYCWELSPGTAGSYTGTWPVVSWSETATQTPSS